MLLDHSMTFWMEVIDLTQIKFAYNTFESLTAEKLRDINRKIKAIKNDPQEKEKLFAEYMSLDMILKQNVRYAMFIAAYAQFEQALFHICDDFRKRYDLTLMPKDIAGQGIKKFQFYLKKVVCINFPDNEPEWQRILALNKFRNYLAHEDRSISENDVSYSEISKIIKKEKYLSANPCENIYFHRHFLRNVVDLFESFILEIAYRSVEDMSSLGSSARRKRISLKSVKSRLNLGVIK